MINPRETKVVKMIKTCKRLAVLFYKSKSLLSPLVMIPLLPMISRLELLRKRCFLKMALSTPDSGTCKAERTAKAFKSGLTDHCTKVTG